MRHRRTDQDRLNFEEVNETYMAKDLPLPLTRSVHVQRLAHSIVDADSVFPVAVVAETIAVHVEDMVGGTVRVDVPDDLVAQAHLEGGVVPEDVTVHGMEARSTHELPGTRKIHDLRVPHSVVARP